MFNQEDISILTAIYGTRATSYMVETRQIARATITALTELPEGYTPVTRQLPTSDAPVLAIRRSGYVACAYELLTARYQPDYRPHSPWRDLSGDSVHDSGEPILGWRWENQSLRPQP